MLLSLHELRQQSADKWQSSWIYIVLYRILPFKIHRLRDLFAISYSLLPFQRATVTIMQHIAVSLDFHTNNLLLIVWVCPSPRFYQKVIKKSERVVLWVPAVQLVLEGAKTSCHELNPPWLRENASAHSLAKKKKDAKQFIGRIKRGVLQYWEQ